nr:MAG TPA: Membrane MotB of proton-channel complex MotA/MotB [Caudoviricetes sp.]
MSNSDMFTLLYILFILPISIGSIISFIRK